MLDWIIANGQWLFSGIGVAVLSLAGVLIAKGYNRWREGRTPADGLSYQHVRTPLFQSRLPAVVLRMLYKPDDIRTRVKIELRSNAPGSVSLGSQLPYVDLYFQVTNLSPVDLVLDRALVDVWFGQPTFTTFLLHRYDVPAGEITEGIHVRHVLADNQKAHIEGFNDAQGTRGQLHIYITAYFESKLGRFFVQASIDRDRL